MNGTPLPHNLDAEAAVIGVCLRHPDLTADVVGRISTTDFYSPKHQEIWTAIADVEHNDVPHDVLIVADWLNRRGKLEACGGVLALSELVDAPPHISNLSYYVDIVLEASARRQLHALGATISALAVQLDLDHQELRERVRDVMKGWLDDAHLG